MQPVGETLDPEAGLAPAAEEGGEELVAVVLFHPELTRVGAVARLGGEVSEAWLIGRETPSFEPAGGGEARPLADPCISRRQARVSFERARRTLRIEGEPGARRAVRVYGAAGEALEGEEVPAGVAVAIGDRVLLWVGLRPRGPSDKLGLLGESAAVVRLRKRIVDVAVGSETVLVQGETGAGKELVARAVHRASRRRGGPLLAVNCAAVPEPLLESELFGHVKGAFTGAPGAAGLFAAASGGTLFLDEIGELPLGLQAKLLRVLDQRRVRPVGSAVEVPVDARVVAATHRDLDAAVAGGFREDLLARLDGLRVRVPPLRERRQDVPVLFAHFLRERLLDDAREQGQRSALLEALERPADLRAPALPLSEVLGLLRHDWPRNVRELAKHALATVAANRGAGPWALPALPAPAPPQAQAAEGAARREPPTAEELLRVLDAHDYVQNRAAAALGVSPATLDRWRRELGVERPRDLPRSVIEEGLARSGGDVRAAARLLRVSARGLKLRLRELGIGGDDLGERFAKGSRKVWTGRAGGGGCVLLRASWVERPLQWRGRMMPAPPPQEPPSPAMLAAIDERVRMLQQLWGLTRRQTEVLAVLARGLSNKEIALELGCSHNTVEIHVGELLRRSGLPGRRALIVAVWMTKVN